MALLGALLALVLERLGLPVATLGERFSYQLDGVQHPGIPPLLPSFVVAFLLLAALNSLVTIPTMVADWAGIVSRWALLVAIAAVGVKTSLPVVFKIGGRAIGVLVADTVFLALIVLAVLVFVGL